jgi:TPR repeat protein
VPLEAHAFKRRASAGVLGNIKKLIIETKEFFMTHLTTKTMSLHIAAHNVESKLQLAKVSRQLMFIQLFFSVLLALSFGLTFNAHALEVWAADAMTKESANEVDPRIKSKSNASQIAEFHIARKAIGVCKQFSEQQQRAWNEMTALGNKGVVEAQTYLASFGMQCKISMPNRAEPMQWAEKAAATGFVPAFEVLAELHEWPGIPNQSPEKGFKAYLAAAEQGSAAAMVWTRVALCLGEGTKKDEAQGAAWGEKLKQWYRANGRSADADKLRSSCH